MSKAIEEFIKVHEKMRDEAKEELDIIRTVWDEMSPPVICAKHNLLMTELMLKYCKEKLGSEKNEQRKTV